MRAIAQRCKTFYSRPLLIHAIFVPQGKKNPKTDPNFCIQEGFFYCLSLFSFPPPGGFVTVIVAWNSAPVLTKLLFSGNPGVGNRTSLHPPPLPFNLSGAKRNTIVALQATLRCCLQGWGTTPRYPEGCGIRKIISKRRNLQKLYSDRRLEFKYFCNPHSAKKACLEVLFDSSGEFLTHAFSFFLSSKPSSSDHERGE